MCLILVPAGTGSFRFMLNLRIGVSLSLFLRGVHIVNLLSGSVVVGVQATIIRKMFASVYRGSCSRLEIASAVAYNKDVMRP
jgi:hypothetical protein